MKILRLEMLGVWRFVHRPDTERAILADEVIVALQFALTEELSPDGRLVSPWDTTT